MHIEPGTMARKLRAQYPGASLSRWHQIVKLLCSDPCSQRKQTVVVCLLLALATVAVYWPVARQGFINFDDPDYVSANPRVQAGLTVESVQWAFTSLYASNWHPLTWLSHELDCQIYGLRAGGHHVTNLLLHIVNSLLLFGLLKRVTGALWRSVFVAALFALHPLHVESVAWVSERKDVLSAFFFMLTLWAYASYVEGQRPRSEGGSPKSEVRRPKAGVWYGAAVVLFALGLMSKPMLVTLPFVLLLLDYWPLGRIQLSTAKHSLSTTEQCPSLKRLVVEKIPFFALSALSCVLTFLVQRACGAMTPLEKAPFELRLANALVAYARYLGKTLWPSKLAVFYPYSQLSLDSWQVMGAALLLLIATVAIVLAAKKQPYLLIGWLWFWGTLVPVIGLVQVGKQALADRYTYLPHIGLFILIVWGAAAVVARLKWPRLISLVAAGLVVTGCGILSARQLSHWRDTKTLFQHAVAVTSRNFVAYAVVGNALAEEDKSPEAIEQCRKALEISPDYPEAHNTLGNIYAKQEKYEEAIANYRAAAEADRTYADPRNGMGDVLVKQGKYAEAEAQCREALRLAPMHLPAMFCLATALHHQGKLDEAAGYYRRILELKPDLYTPRRYLGNIFVAQGKPDQAIPQLLLALKIRPQDADTHVVLGVVLLEKNRIEEATAQFLEAARLQPTNAIANYQLALIHQGRKETRAAIDCYRKALKAQLDWPESLNNLAWILAANPDATLRNGAEAVGLAERACKLTDYKEGIFVGTLAAAYAEAGRLKEAVSSAEKARSLALAAGQKEIAQKNEELLEIYRAGRAYHESE
jgi:tetratricopeptide (TPR) repeat protein